jgi:hypothetical protein
MLICAGRIPEELSHFLNRIYPLPLGDGRDGRRATNGRVLDFCHGDGVEFD